MDRTKPADPEDSQGLLRQVPVVDDAWTMVLKSLEGFLLFLFCFILLIYSHYVSIYL